MYYVLLLLLLLPCPSQSPKSDCVAGQHWVALTESCETCPARVIINDDGVTDRQWKYSEDGVSKCSKCPELGKRCLCDTTPPLVYWAEQGPPLSVCNSNCTEECYSTARFTLVGEKMGRISNLVDWINCTCTNTSSCFTKYNITNSCFLNDCDRPRDEGIARVVNQCFDEGARRCNTTCYEQLAPHLPLLHKCNCYGAEDKVTCSKYLEFYRTCIKPPWDKSVVVMVTVAIFSVLVVSVVCFLSTKHVTFIHQRLKETGNLADFLPYIHWCQVEPIGTTKDVISKRGDQFIFAEREILLKVPYCALNKLPMIPHLLMQETVVLKLYSNSRGVAQTKEVAVLSALSEKHAASRCNIIDMIGCNHGNSGLSDFLGELVTKSSAFCHLQEVLTKYYDDRSKYMMLRFCNGLSLDHFIQTRYGGVLPSSLLLPLATDMATALKFLHTNTPTIIHCDIKPQNIFVQEDSFHRPRFILGDFGFAETYSKGELWRLRGSTTAFLPPEWMICQYKFPDEDKLTDDQKKAVSEKHVHPTAVDIYQLGLTLWQIIHGEPDPWSRDPEYIAAYKEAGKAWNHEAMKRYLFDMFLSDFNKRPSLSTDTSCHVVTRCYGDVTQSRGSHVTLSRGLYNGLMGIVDLCWQVDLPQRITAGEVLSRLQKLGDVAGAVVFDNLKDEKLMV